TGLSRSRCSSTSSRYRRFPTCTAESRWRESSRRTNATSAESTLRDVTVVARSIGLQIQVLMASTSLEIEATFASFMRERPDALFVSADAYFYTRRVQITHLVV